MCASGLPSSLVTEFAVYAFIVIVRVWHVKNAKSCPEIKIFSYCIFTRSFQVINCSRCQHICRHYHDWFCVRTFLKTGFQLPVKPIHGMAFFLDIISIKLSLFPTMGILTTRRSICKICLAIRFRSHWAKANAKYFHACCISVWLPFKLRRTIFRGIRFFSLSVKKDYVIEKLELFKLCKFLAQCAEQGTVHLLLIGYIEIVCL